MKMPFTVDQFLAVFERYNLAIWPLQVLAYLMAVAAVYLVLKGQALRQNCLRGTVALLDMGGSSLSYQLFQCHQ